MGESAAETVREIEETRSRLESDLRELEDRLPAPVTWGKRLVGLAVGGGIGGTVFWFGVRRMRKKRKEKAAQAKAQQAVVQLIPAEWAERIGGALEEGEWRGWLVLAGSAWVLLRLAELRQLRRMNRVMLASRPGPLAPP
jgi:hypothetical protein